MKKNSQNDSTPADKETIINALNGQYADKVSGKSLIKLNVNVSKKKRAISVPTNWDLLVNAYVEYVLKDQGVGAQNGRRNDYADEIFVELVRLQIKGDKGFREFLDASASENSTDKNQSSSVASA